MRRRYRRIVIDDRGAAKRDAVDWLAVVVCLSIVVAACALVVGVAAFVLFVLHHGSLLRH